MSPDAPAVYDDGIITVPLLWCFRGINGEWRQQCDDEAALDRRWLETRGLAYDTEGEAPGDFG
jgi:hypothetical protein